MAPSNYNNDLLINFMDFNQSGSCISLGTTKDFRLFNIDPFQRFEFNDFSSRANDSSSIDKDFIINKNYGIVEMLYTTSLLVLVGSGGSTTTNNTNFNSQSDNCDTDMESNLNGQYSSSSTSLSPRCLRILNVKNFNIIGDLTFPNTILSIKMNHSNLIVLLRDKIYIYNIKTLNLIHIIELQSNNNNLISITYSDEQGQEQDLSTDSEFKSKNLNYLVYPSPPKVVNSDIKSNLTTNDLIIPNDISTSSDNSSSPSLLAPSYSSDNNTINNSNINPNTNTVNNNNNTNNNDEISNQGDVILFNLNTLQPIMVIEAHKGEIAALTLSNDGKLLATASKKGTIIRVFSTDSGSKLYQFRRGTYPTQIYSISFSHDNKFISVTCSSKTVHIFKLEHSRSHSQSKDSGEDSNEILDNNTTNNSIHSENSTAGEDIMVLEKNKPYVDNSRKTVGRLIRQSSQQLSRQAAQTLGNIFPIKVKSLLEPSRHFASLKIPNENNNSNNNNSNNNNSYNTALRGNSAATTSTYDNTSEVYDNESMNNDNNNNMNSGNSESLQVKCITTIGTLKDINIKHFPELFDIKNAGVNNPNQSSKITTDDVQMNNENTSAEKDPIIKVLPIRVVSSNGYLYNYVMDPERGGDCLLISKYSLLSD
ncbi:hypothetical protein TBLA_0D04920 [Henningerozyma blattae CBS 6284]|uniref:Autophagy-related protein 18 n=1 Tax=Henningerozyma blattae (strain ATCC 34711 / CBS 6284 / DSM 70876 / NBRC 10599 / NRRL Y-10934 / UCD 77-7) TaxID=1071380 RepID=I2H3N5_HENB6|nr:hypothetical protein TBLA_0D04920 [Tetrapisispora blattae CBS 6284]CCH60987.1 hypothetical protein TBLA_0D04920 [Tetrapisispora blattae CBS 6284]